MKLMKDPEFVGRLFVLEKQAWQCFVSAVEYFQGNNKEENYRDLICNFVVAHKEMSCQLSPKLHVLHSHSDFFKL